MRRETPSWLFNLLESWTQPSSVLSGSYVSNLRAARVVGVWTDFMSNASREGTPLIDHDYQFSLSGSVGPRNRFSVIQFPVGAGTQADGHAAMPLL